jgi:hypothetical protein
MKSLRHASVVRFLITAIFFFLLLVPTLFLFLIVCLDPRHESLHRCSAKEMQMGHVFLLGIDLLVTSQVDPRQNALVGQDV